jgi:hypothetical protein
MSSLKKTIKFNPLDTTRPASSASKKPVAAKGKPTKKGLPVAKPTKPAKKLASLKTRSVKETSLSSSTITAKKAPLLKTNPATKQPPPLTPSVEPVPPLWTTDYVIQASGDHGSSPLLVKGTDFGFEVPDLDFISLKSPEMRGQLKDHFLLPRVIGGFVLGGPVGYALSFILGKPNNKHYFFLVKSSHGKLVFARFDSLTLAYVINRIYT